MNIRLTSVIAATLVAIFASACANDGRTFAEPSSDQTTTTRLTTTSALPQEVSTESGFELSSPDFSPAGEVPLSMICEGGSELPVLEWENTPVDTQELAISLADYSDFTEPLLVWLAAGIAPNVTSLDLANPPEGLVETQNDWGSTGFGSPCIESIDSDNANTTRDLQFRIYALSSTSGLTQGAHGNDSWTEIKAKSFESAAVLTRYFPTTESDQEESIEAEDSLETFESIASTGIQNNQTPDPTGLDSTELEE